MPVTTFGNFDFRTRSIRDIHFCPHLGWTNLINLFATLFQPTVLDKTSDPQTICYHQNSQWRHTKRYSPISSTGTVSTGLAAPRNMHYIHVTHELSETLGYFSINQQCEGHLMSTEHDRLFVGQGEPVWGLLPSVSTRACPLPKLASKTGTQAGDQLTASLHPVHGGSGAWKGTSHTRPTMGAHP